VKHVTQRTHTHSAEYNIAWTEWPIKAKAISETGWPFLKLDGHKIEVVCEQYKAQGVWEHATPKKFLQNEHSRI